MKKDKHRAFKISGTPSHISYVTMEEGDTRRHRSRCRFFSDGFCTTWASKCHGSSHCDQYDEITTKKQSNDDREEIYPHNEHLKTEKNTIKNKLHTVVEHGDRIVLLSYEKNEEFNLDIPQNDDVNSLAKLAAASLGKSIYSTVEYNGRYYKIIRIMKGVASEPKMR